MDSLRVCKSNEPSKATYQLIQHNNELSRSIKVTNLSPMIRSGDEFECRTDYREQPPTNEQLHSVQVDLLSKTQVCCLIDSKEAISLLNNFQCLLSF